MPSQSDWVISLSRACTRFVQLYYISISISILVSRAAPPARKQRVQVVAFNERDKNSWENIPILAQTEKHFFLCVLVFFLCQDRTDTTWKRKKEEATRERERKREREKERERTKRTRASFNQKHNHNSTTFCREKKTQNRKLCLSTHHGEPRSGGNLERVTREKRERGAFLIVCVGCVFSLFFLSDKRSARKVRERFCSFKRSDSLSEEGVCGSIPKQIIKRDESFSLFSIVLFSTNERTTTTILASSVLLSSLVVTESLVVVYHSFT
mgnify:CR=1 FL=1